MHVHAIHHADAERRHVAFTLTLGPHEPRPVEPLSRPIWGAAGHGIFARGYGGGLEVMPSEREDRGEGLRVGSLERRLEFLSVHLTRGESLLIEPYHGFD